MEGGFEGVEIGGGGFDEEQDFGAGRDGSPPAIDRGDAGDDVDAGGQALFDEGTSDVFGFILGDGGGEDDATISGGYGHMRNRVQRTATGEAASV